MQSTTAPITAMATLYRNGMDELVGVVYAIPADGGRTYYLAEAHDWDADNPSGAYIGTEAGTYADPESAARIIEIRARAAQAPETLNVTL
jgi:hypothetical protein